MQMLTRTANSDERTTNRNANNNGERTWEDYDKLKTHATHYRYIYFLQITKVKSQHYYFRSAHSHLAFQRLRVSILKRAHRAPPLPTLVLLLNTMRSISSSSFGGAVVPVPAVIRD